MVVIVIPKLTMLVELKDMLISKELFYLLRNYTFEMWIIEVDLVSIVHAMM